MTETFCDFCGTQITSGGGKLTIDAAGQTTAYDIGPECLTALGTWRGSNETIASFTPA